MRPDKNFDYTEPLAASIRDLLFREWDPCSVNLNADCANEYDDYIPAIHKLAIARKPAEEIAAYLNFVEKKYMGGTVDKDLNRAVAAKIFALAEATVRR
jgi:hypothetical protein